MTSVAILSHFEWQEVNNEAFVAETTADAENAARARILEITSEGRDLDEFPDDEEWVDTCLSESFMILTAGIKGDAK